MKRGNTMLSRVAHSVYWMFRYLERAQNIARFIDSDIGLYLDDPKNKNNLWHSLIAATGDHQRFEERYEWYNRENILTFLTTDAEYPGSIISSLTAARENARTIREIISSEMWEAINSLYLVVRDTGPRMGSLADPNELCKAVLSRSYLIAGLFYSTMNRGVAWHFGRIGMLLERADKTSRILDVKYYLLLPDANLVGTAYDNIQWAALLKSVSALEMYRKRYRRIAPSEVIEFLLFDRHFPRSVQYCIAACRESVGLTGIDPASIPRLAVGRSLSRLTTEIDTGTVDEVFSIGMHEYLDSLQTRLDQVHADLYTDFFAPHHTVSAGVTNGEPRSTDA
jgi:uncharacterized alpha-E superfamily protein